MTWTCINHKIFIGFTQFLLGPKYNGKFVIDCARDHKRSDVVRLRGAFAGASLAVYFDSRIRIASCLYGPDGAKYSNVFLTCQDAGDGMPDDLDAYIHDVLVLLRELARHADRFGIEHWFYGYMRGPVPALPYQGAVTCEMAEAVSSWAGILHMPFRFSDRDLLRAVGLWMSSRKFRRACGDFK